MPRVSAATCLQVRHGFGNVSPEAPSRPFQWRREEFPSIDLDRKLGRGFIPSRSQLAPTTGTRGLVPFGLWFESWERGFRVDGTSYPKLGGLYGPPFKRHVGVPVPSTPSTLNPL